MIDTIPPAPQNLLADGPMDGLIPAYFLYTLFTVLAIAFVFYWLIRQTGKKETALEILKKRYASGEMDLLEFRRLREELEE